mmetsp:Transcript_7198/g.11339  ORF Transcript_7198/g.11339 Transcript_7198/m.11339 type:complete len:106 (+) Transcript_7198:276-593(+)
MLRNSYRPNNYDFTESEQLLENYSLIHQIGYLKPETVESDGVHKFMGVLMNKFIRGNNGQKEHLGGQPSWFIQKKGRGRPKRVEIAFEDMQDPNSIEVDTHLQRA